MIAGESFYKGSADQTANTSTASDTIVIDFRPMADAFRAAGEKAREAVEALAAELAQLLETFADEDAEARRERRKFWRERSRRGWRRPGRPVLKCAGRLIRAIPRRRPEIRRSMGNANRRD